LGSPSISVRDLVKDFRSPKRHPGLVGSLRTLFTSEQTVTRAVDGVSFEVGEGELVGYLGPNGAGKSTTIKMLTGILVPTAGEVEVGGLIPWRQREQNALNIGVVFGQRTQLWWDLPLVESFKLIQKMYRMPEGLYRRNVGRFMDLLELDAFINTPVRQLSLGQRMRGDLAAAMLYEPRVLYLDEPTVGLDVLAKERIRGFVEELNQTNHTTVILTTHDMSDVERLCKRVVVIDQGRVIYDGSVSQLKAEYAPYRVLVIQLASELDVIEAPGAEQIGNEDGRVSFRFDPEQTRVADLIGAITSRYPVTDLSIVEPDLEGVIKQIYRERAHHP
jgi:ABC-2 type transport system ATP-binding protein